MVAVPGGCHLPSMVAVPGDVAFFTTITSDDPFLHIPVFPACSYFTPKATCGGLVELRVQS